LKVGVIPNTEKPESTVGGIVLAAGQSSRMGTPKALLDFRGLTFLEVTLGALAAAGVKETIVVLGHHANQIRSSIDLGVVMVVANPHPEAGQLSSLQVGLGTVPAHWQGVIVSLVDHPGISPSTIESLIATWRNEPGTIVIPRYRNRRGHPVLFDRQFIPALLTAPLHAGARAVILANRAAVREIDLLDPAICRDVDYPEDYRELLKNQDREGNATP